MWGRCVYRWSDSDFEANAREGYGVDWPIRYKDLAPGGATSEKSSHPGTQGKLGAHAGRRISPAVGLNAAEAKGREILLQKFGGERIITNARLAVITENHLGRQKCHLCGTVIAAASRAPTSAVSMRRCGGAEDGESHSAPAQA